MATVKVKDPVAGYLDENGCVKSQNDIALQFNKELKEEIVKLRGELTDAAIVYVDMYTAKYELISKAKSQGDHFSAQNFNFDSGVFYLLYQDYLQN